jgi:RNA polymerase sigma-70 factor (ECF subfamily)
MKIVDPATDCCNQCDRPDEMSGDAFRDDFESGLRALWMRAQSGDEAAYRDEVEDLVQETLIALHLQRGTYDPALPVSAWVFAIARHKLVDLWRRRGRREALHDPLDELDDSAHPCVLEEFPVRHDLLGLLDALPPAQRRAIALTRLEGLSVAEASQRCGVSVSALKVQVHRGLKRLTVLARRGS